MNNAQDPLELPLQPTLPPRRHLNTRILRRIRSDSPEMDHDDVLLEETLETLLRAWPVSPRETFIVETLQRTRSPISGQDPSHGGGLTRTIGILAACLAFALILPNGFERPASTPAARFTAAAPPPIDEDIATLLALADDLPQTTRWLLDDATLVTFVSELP